MVEFNLSQIPAGSVVTAAELQLYVLDVSLRDLASQNINVHPISQNWQEDAVNWTQRGGGNWSSQGGSYGGSIASAPFSGLTAGTWQTFTLPTATVQAWTISPAANYGLLLKRNSDGNPGQAFRHNKAIFADHSNVALRPKLVITYTAAGNVKPVASMVTPSMRDSTAPREAYVLSATANDVDGAVTKVEFLADGQVLGEDTSAPYSYRWQHVPASTPTITARAYDDSGASADSASVPLRVQSAIYSANMDTNPGWTLGSGWQYGRPQGYYVENSSTDDGDPSSGFTGSNVVGYRFTGTLPKLTSAVAARTPAIDCSDYSDVVLSFYYWLGIGERYNSFLADVQASVNGTTWQTLWSNPRERMGVGVWRRMVIDISSIADGQPTVYIRWTMGPGNRYSFAGWNIDDVLVLGTPPPPTVPDTDGDGMSDAWEAHHFEGSGQADTNDWDGDGATDLDEFLAGTDPTAADDSMGLSLAHSSTGSVVSFVAAEAGTNYYTSPRYYSLETCTNLSIGQWTGVPPLIGVLGEGQTIALTNQLGRSQYFRLKCWLGD